ncbi:MAG: helix-turn-helix domain-containing protein [Lachnospiraceae bacterium]|nr:helix-turn-helix domain-containing protein [Lachnospiraceae bacterium]
MGNKYSNRGITYETLEKAVSGDYSAMQEVIRLFKPYMTKLSIEDGRFDNELFERLVQRLMFITWQFDMHYSEK